MAVYRANSCQSAIPLGGIKGDRYLIICIGENRNATHLCLNKTGIEYHDS
jgi:hypothetical protein